MRANRASRTAEMVALWRALAHEGLSGLTGFSDPFAAPLLGGWAKRTYERTLARVRASGRRPRGFGASDFVILRVLALDRLLLDAVAAGARQCVILGAGFDTRAWRLPALAAVRTFEVDHPATQALKRERAAVLPAPLGPHTWVPVDFLRDRLPERLAAAGFDPAVPTVWLWEGVVMYLRDEAVRAMLADVAALSAPGSTLLLHYHAPGGYGLRNLLRLLVLWLIGEPQVGQRSPEATAALVRGAGLVPERDLGLDEQAALTGTARPPGTYGEVSRILVASLARR